MLMFERGGGGNEIVLPLPEQRSLAPDLVVLARQLGRDQDPLVRQLIAKAHTNDYVMNELRQHIVRMMRSQEPNAGVAAYGKLAAGTLMPMRARMAVQIGGGRSLLWEDGDLDEMHTGISYLNCRMPAIAGGTNEVQRNGIAERVLGLPREPSFDLNKPFREVSRNAKAWAERQTDI
jgi:hypothetical protein